MEIKPAFLILADISGYTQFLKYHTISLLHAEKVITELLESIIDSSKHPLKINKLEGDAIFFYAFTDGDEMAAARDILHQAIIFYQAFRTKERELLDCTICPCDGCKNIDQLKLKVIFHHGEVAIKRVKQFEELAGEEVILAHRLMKNSVEEDEYFLMSQPFYKLSGGLPSQEGKAMTETYPELGSIDMMVYDPTSIEFESLPQPKPATIWNKSKQELRFVGYALARRLRLRKGRIFSHLPVAAENRPD